MKWTTLSEATWWREKEKEKEEGRERERDCEERGRMGMKMKMKREEVRNHQPRTTRNHTLLSLLSTS